MMNDFYKKTSTVFFATMLVASCLKGQSKEKRPNILLITADDMNWNSVGIYGCDVAETTPNIDKLAQEGIRFDNAFVSISLSTPCRQVMLSGCHSHQTMTRCFTELERVGPALPDILKEEGYLIANINKQQDFYEWDVAVTEKETAMGRDIPANTNAVKEIIQRAGDKPWFIMMNFNDPHRPFYNSESQNNSKNYAEYRDKGRLSKPSKVFKTDEVRVPGFLPDLPEIKQEMAEYYSSVRRCDDGVGCVLDVLKQKGIYDNTIVVFLSDHGISMPFSKLNCYHTSLHVPLILRYPKWIKAGSRDVGNVVSVVDLAPTLIEMIGLKSPDYMAGRSFLPLVKGEEQDSREYTVGYYYRNLRQDNMFPEFTVHMRDWVYIYNPWANGVKEVHNADYTNSPSLKAIWAAADSLESVKKRSDFHKYRVKEELYNIRQDPNSYINLADDAEFKTRVENMRQILVDWMVSTKHPALELMRDPFNQTLIESYMAWEKENARKQDAEVRILEKSK
ncbi:MAG: sulfatase [Bacteroidales bacterium]|nr:sulfatase [Bacteroidales bacterium]